MIVLAAGLGVLAFFLPFHRYELGARDLDVSAYRIVVGFDRAAQLDPAHAELEPWRQDRILRAFNHAIAHEQSRDGFGDELSKERRSPVPYYFAAAIGLVLIAASCLWTRCLGLFGALGAIACGLCALWGYTRELLVDRNIARTALALGKLVDTSTVAAGATLLLVVGLFALIAGVGGLAFVDPGGFGKPRPRRPELPRARVVSR